MSEPDAEVRGDARTDSAFRAVVAAETIQTATALVGSLVSECRIHLDDTGTRLGAIDPATVASVDVELGRDAFELYEGSGATIGVDLERLETVVGIADRGQLVNLALDLEAHTLELEVGDLRYTLALLDLETIRSPPDRSDLDLDFSGSAVTGSGDFHRAVRAADMVSDFVAFGLNGDAAAFYAEAEGDTDEVSLALSVDDLVDLDPGDAHSLFSIDYLTAIDRALPDDIDVELQLGTEAPIEIDASFADGTGSVAYLVSPRIAAH